MIPSYYLGGDVVEREKGDLPLSIGTSLAFQSLTNDHPDIKHRKSPLERKDLIYVNLLTLLRNIYGATGETRYNAYVDDLYLALVEEIKAIDDWVRMVNYDRPEKPLKCIFYVCNYQGISNLDPNVSIRVNNTDKQLIFTSYVKTILKALFKEKKFCERYNIVQYDLRIKHEYKDALILTHLPFDLLVYDKFRSLTLIESHTGKLKDKYSFNTKYYHGKDLRMIPFTEKFLFVFGDRDMFKPMPINIRRTIIDIATKYKWTPMIRNYDVKRTLGFIKDPAMRSQILSILSL